MFKMIALATQYNENPIITTANTLYTYLKDMDCSKNIAAKNIKEHIVNMINAIAHEDFRALSKQEKSQLLDSYMTLINDYLVDPISLERFKTPILTNTHMTFEKEHLETWFTKNGAKIDPTNREPITSTTFDSTVYNTLQILEDKPPLSPPIDLNHLPPINPQPPPGNVTLLDYLTQPLSMEPVPNFLNFPPPPIEILFQDANPLLIATPPNLVTALPPIPILPVAPHP